MLFCDSRSLSRAALVEDLANRLAAALEVVMGWAKTGDAWQEAKHPRAPDGRFGSKSGEHGEASIDEPKPTTARGANAKTRLRELLSSGHPFTKQELMSIAGIEKESTFTTWIGMLKNPKYAGKAGTLDIVRNKDGTYQALPKGATPPAPPPGPPAPPAPPREEPKAAPKPLPMNEAQRRSEVMSEYRELRTKSWGLSEKAQSEKQHRAAAEIHAKVKKLLWEAKGLGIDPKAMGISDGFDERIIYHASLQHKHETRAEMYADMKRNQDPKQLEQDAIANKRYATMTREEIDAAMRERFGMGVAGHKDWDDYRVQKVKAIDLDGSSNAAKNQRKILGQVHRAMEELEEAGFDVKAVLADANIKYAPGTLTKYNGLAWQANHYRVGGSERSGNFVVSSSQMTFESIQRQHEVNRERMSQGQGTWTHQTTLTGSAATRSVIVHELAHAVGLQSHINSPAKLEEILHKMQPDFKLRQEWVKKHISKYAATNIRETDAELAATVASPDYKRGTLPKVLEDHVDWLFKRRQS